MGVMEHWLNHLDIIQIAGTRELVLPLHFSQTSLAGEQFAHTLLVQKRMLMCGCRRSCVWGAGEVRWSCNAPEVPCFNTS